MVLYTPGRTSSYPDEPVESGIRIHFLGGGDEVGNVGVILEDETSTIAEKSWQGYQTMSSSLTMIYAMVAEHVSLYAL